MSNMSYTYITITPIILIILIIKTTPTECMTRRGYLIYNNIYLEAAVDIAVALLECGDTLVDVVGADNDICHLAIGKGVHILDEDFLCGEVFEDR